MRCRISRSDHDAILAESAAQPAREVCGLLFGAHDAIVAVRACANVAEDPARRFEIDPAALFAALRAERAGGPVLVGHYHSHPSGETTPSATDAAMALPDGRIWLIAGQGVLTAWRAVRNGAIHGRFVPLALDISPVATMGALRQKAHDGVTS